MLTKILQPLFRLPRRQKRLIQLMVDVVLITFSFVMAMLLRLGNWSFLAEPRIWLVLPAMVPLSLAIFIRLGFYRAVIRYMSMKALKAVMAGVAASALSLVLINYLLSLPVPRSVPIIYLITHMVQPSSGTGTASAVFSPPPSESAGSWP